MSGGIYVALSGAIAQTESLDATAANLANASTEGYQRVRPVFREALASAQNQANGGLRGVSTSAVTLDTSRGEIRSTGNPLDVVLPDNAYLAASTPKGERYTRAGSLNVSTTGTLQTRAGAPIVGEDGNPIKTTPGKGEVKISPAGEVFQAGAKLGRVKMVQFASPGNLMPEGTSLLATTPAAGAMSPAKGELSIGAVEQSNTSAVGAMTDLVNANRTFEAFQRAIESFHSADQKAATVASDP